MNFTVTGAWFMAALAFAGCASKSGVRLPPRLSVPEPTRILGSTHLKAPSEIDAPKVRLKIEIDISRVEKSAPYIRVWAEHAARVCKEWYPVLCAEFAGEGFKPRDKITFVFLPHHSAPAAYRDGRIFVSTDDLCEDLSDYGMMIHELVHAVQEYRDVANLGWLEEGIADYMRFYLYEADPIQGGIEPGRSKYSDSYRTTACFLDYLVRKYDRNIVRKFNAVMRKGGVTEDGIKGLIAKNPDVKPTERRNIEMLFEAFIAEWTERHLQKEPNQTLEPTATSVTPPAAQESLRP